MTLTNSRSSSRSLAAAAFLLLFPVQGAVAHDVWLRWQPADAASARSATVRPGDRVDVQLLVGHGDDDPQPVARNERLLERFVALGPDGREMPLRGLHGVDPAGVFRPDAPGPWSVIYVGKPVEHHLPADAFEAYLEEEGLGRILALRQGEATTRPGRELFSRSLQTLLWVGPNESAAREDVNGAAVLPVRFELRRGAGGMARLTLLADGRPVPEALVDLRVDGRLVRSLRTDSAGSLEVRLDAGEWVATAVVLRPIDDPRADWRTIFAAMSFPWPDAYSWPHATPRSAGAGGPAR